MRFPSVTLQLPDWVERHVSSAGEVFPEVEDRMRLAIDLSRLGVRHGTGGPFGAAVFEQGTGRLIAPGVNLVTSSGCSVFHAEMVAMMLAQSVVGGFELGDCELVTSTEPCAMCFGGVGWSGVGRLVCGARTEDAEEIGFDEGTKPAYWTEALEERGISVKRDVLREDAVSALREYAAGGGEIYNPGKGS
jgi:tRNA(Arg) A34 adenosine deaminase TadA